MLEQRCLHVSVSVALDTECDESYKLFGNASEELLLPCPRVYSVEHVGLAVDEYHIFAGCEGLFGGLLE